LHLQQLPAVRGSVGNGVDEEIGPAAQRIAKAARLFSVERSCLSPAFDKAS
jgi:hypothetical protein